VSTSAERPKNRSHIALEMTSATGPFGVASSAENPRPITGETPNVSKKFQLTLAAIARSASAPLLTFTVPPPPDAARLVTDFNPSRQSRHTCGGTFTLLLRCDTCQTRTSPSLGNGSGCRNAAFAVVNIRLVVPRPIPSVSIATAENTGTRSSERTATRKSRIRASMCFIRGQRPYRGDLQRSSTLRRLSGQSASQKCVRRPWSGTDAF